jgi:iron complex outermembrane recepter protein
MNMKSTAPIRAISLTAMATMLSFGSTGAGAQTADTPAAQESSATRAPNIVADIVVTAQRKNERNQDVPISITAFSAERLQQQNIETGQDLSGVVPSLQVGNNGLGTREVEGFTLRGIGPSNQGATSVVVYLSDVPLPQGYAFTQQGGPGNYVDLESVQVLAGPQGTLFGRNTTGGAVLLVPHRPTNNVEGYIQGSYGNYDYVGLEGVLNIPLVDDKVLFRASGTYQDRDGYTRDLVWNKDRDDLHYYAGRIGILLKPSERVENYLMAYGADSSNNGTAWVLQDVLLPRLVASGRCAPDPTCAVYLRQAEIAKAIGPRANRQSIDTFEKTRTWGIINKTSVEISDALTINNIISYQRYRKDFVFDQDGSPLQISDAGPARYPDFPVAGLTDQFGLPVTGYNNAVPNVGPRDNLKQFTEELQLQGSLLDNDLTFTAGGFYYDQQPVSIQRQRTVSGCHAVRTGQCEATSNVYQVSNNSRALYAQATFDFAALTPALASLRLTGGYRYTWDKIEGSSTFFIGVGGGNVFCISSGLVTNDPSLCTYSARLKSRAPTWTVGLDYKPISDLLLFAKVSRGYKAGGYSAYAVRVATRTFDPERITSYEVGFKSDWRLGSVPLRLNMTAYQADYSNIQINMVDFANGLTGSQVRPAKAQIRGVEADATIRPFPILELGGNVSYTDAGYKKFTYFAQAPTEACNGLVAAGGLVDASCTPYGANKWIYNIRASLDLPTPESLGALSLFANYSHLSSFATSPREPGGILEPFGLLNLSAKLRSVARTGVDLEMFVTNATNKLYRIGNSNISGNGYYSSLFGEPRMYGVRLRYRFGE